MCSIHTGPRNTVSLHLGAVASILLQLYLCVARMTPQNEQPPCSVDTIRKSRCRSLLYLSSLAWLCPSSSFSPRLHSLLVWIFPSHHWKGKTSQGVFGAGCFCNILIFQVDVFQIHSLFSWGGQESHKAHYYFSRTWKTITMLIKRARGKAWLQSRKTKDRKSRWTDTTYCGGNWEVITAAVNPRAGDFETIASYLAFPFIKATYIRTFGQNIKTIKEKIKLVPPTKTFRVWLSHLKGQL